jgi:hypothetical protein
MSKLNALNVFSLRLARFCHALVAEASMAQLSTGDDIDNDAEDAGQTELVNDMTKHNINESTVIASSHGVPPKKHTLEELVSVREASLLWRVYYLSQMLQPLLILPSCLFITIYFSS